MTIKTLKKLSAPDQTNCILTKPEFKNWASLLIQNKASIAAIDGTNKTRTELIDIAVQYTTQIGISVSHPKISTNIIATGHQPTWHHCGIFAKNIVTHKLASQTHAVAIQLILDHDICNTAMSLPQYNNDSFPQIRTISLHQNQQKIPLEFRDAPSKDNLKIFIDSILKSSKDSFCSEIWRQNPRSITDTNLPHRTIADTITQQQARLNQALGLDIIYLPVSLMAQTNSFIDFLCAILKSPVSFVSAYNQAIKNKRQTNNLKPNQTLRLLKTNHLSHIVELPFWLVSNTGKRAALYVSLDDKNLRIGRVEQAIGIIDSVADKKQQLLEILKKNKYMIRPKAVTLTLFARLYLTDLFVHGTGAENYEYITDHLVGDFYKVTKSNFGIATATMTLPNDTDNPTFKIPKEILNNREFFFGLFPRDRLEKLADLKEVKNEDCSNRCPAPG